MQTSTQGEPHLRALFLIGLEEIVTEHGGDLGLLLEECGLPALARTNYELLVPYRGVHALMELVARRFDLPNLGLEWAQRMAPHHADVGPVLAMARCAATVRDWYRDFALYLARHNNSFRLDLDPEIRPGVSRLRERNRLYGHPSRQSGEKMMANSVLVMRQGTGREDFAPLLVRFQHARPRDITLHERIFRCPVEFGCDEDSIEFDAAFLDAPTAGAMPPLRAIVRKYVQHRANVMPVYDPSMATHVSLVVGSMIGTGQTSLGAIADILGFSSKKLQRLLAGERTSFSAVQEDLRRKLALDMLAHSSAPVGLIASLLDYSGNAAFTLAFRKWTGTSPLRWRQQHRQQPPLRLSA
ncbi:MAG: AraC family transcriptional regulator ligand-binding domain-containing protein [Sphingomonadales bacterium]|nr:AraC family transcriptional regulator ligand-binding domain-containing protein [Sphingomonadales bacterium]